MRGFANRRLGALVLLAPLLVFLGLFFVWPLAIVLIEAVSDKAIVSALPLTKKVAAKWDKNSIPGQEFQNSFVQDLRGLDDQRIGELIRRLNSEHPGFRTLMSKTVTTIRRQSSDIDLVAIDKRWAQVEYWSVLVGALSPYTDRNLLAAVDLERDKNGSVVSRRAGESANRLILARTFLVSAIVTGACILIGLPYAILLASRTGWSRRILLGAVLLPLWTSLLVRTAAWYILLQDQGVINRTLADLGLISHPIPLMFNRLGVIIAMTHVLLPFMVLPIYSVLISIPANLMPAAASLGANPLRAFWRVLMPLSVRGVTSGSLLVFMAAIGYYITPALIGGPNDQMISSVIAFYGIGSANWGMASALGLILLVVTLALYTLYSRLSAGTPAGV
jgi:putative spermidine/putrescine transport system permease protein